MSSIILIPDEILANPVINHQNDNADYTFTLNTSQQEIINRLYKGKESQNIQLQMQFLQSSNQLSAAKYYPATGLYDICIEAGGAGIAKQVITVEGTFYTISAFNTYLLGKLNAMFASVSPTKVEFGVNDDMLQNEGIWNLELKASPIYHAKIDIVFHGYQLIQMLGLSHSTSETTISWLYPANEQVVLNAASRHFYTPVVTQYNVATTLQQKTNIYYDQDSKMYNLCARVINSIQSGDFASIVTNIQMPAIDIEQLFQFKIVFYDANFHICRWLDWFSICLTVSDIPNVADVQKIISNRSV